MQNHELKNPGLTHGASPFSTSLFFGEHSEVCDRCVQNGHELCKFSLSCCPSITRNQKLCRIKTMSFEEHFRVDVEPCNPLQ